MPGLLAALATTGSLTRMRRMGSFKFSLRSVRLQVPVLSHRPLALRLARTGLVSLRKAIMMKAKQTTG